MNKRPTRPAHKKKAAVERKSLSYMVCAWVGAAFSLLLLIPTGGAIGVDVTSFRSCGVNNNDLYMNVCGKQGLNGGDFVILLLFLGSVSIVICLFTHAWRSSRKPA
jgi:hypothetical protein